MRQVILSDDKHFLGKIAAFISSEQQAEEKEAQAKSASIDIESFWKRLTDDYGDVMQKLAQ